MSRNLARTVLVAFPILAAALSIGGTATPGFAQQPDPPTLLEGHTNAVATLTAAPDGRTLVTGSFDRTVRFWDLSSGKLLRSLQGHQGQVLSLAASPDGRTVLSGSRDGTVRIWDAFVPGPLATFTGSPGPVGVIGVSSDGGWIVSGAGNELRMWQLADGELLGELAGHAADVTRTAISKDDATLGSGDADGVVRLWSAEDGEPLGQLGSHVGAVSSLAFHPTSPLLLTSGVDGTWKLWQLPIEPPIELDGHAEGVAAVALARDGKTAVTGADKTVRVFDFDAEQPPRALEELPGAVTAIALSDDASITAAAGDDGAVRLWDTAEGTPRGVLLGHEGAASDVAFNAEQTRIATAGEDGTVRIWRLPEPARALDGHTMPIASVAVTADGKLAASGSADKTVRLWNPADGSLVSTVEGFDEAVQSVTFSSDGEQLASGEAAGAIRLTKVADGAAAGTLLGHAGAVTGVRFTPDGTGLVSTGDDGLLRWWGLPVAAPIPLAGHTEAIQVAVTSPDGKLIYTGGADPTIRVFDAATGEPVRQLAGHVGPVTALAVDKAAGLIASANEQGEIRFWKADGTPLLTDANLRLLGHEGAVAGLAFHPEGKQIASAGADGTVRIWDLPVEPKEFAGGDVAVQAVAISADGTRIATSATINNKPTVQIREVATGKVVGSLLGHEGAIHALAFSGDGKRLASGSADKTARVWDLSDPKFPELALFEGHTGTVQAVAFSADAGQVFSGGADMVIRQWAVEDASEVRTLEGHTGAINHLTLVDKVLASAAADKTARIWNPANGQAVRTLTHESPVISLAVSAAGDRIASSAADKSVALWNVADGKLIATLAASEAGATNGLAFSADAALIAGGSSDGLRVWDESGRVLERLATESDVRGVAFDEATLIAAAADNSLQIATRSLTGTIAAHEDGAVAVLFSPDGSQLVSGGADTSVRVWNAADGQPMGELAGAQEAITALAVSADGGRLLATSEDKSAYVWDLSAVAVAKPLDAQRTFVHDEIPHHLDVSGDGSRAATCTADGRIHIWDLESGLLLQRLVAHEGAAQAVRFLDPARVVSAGIDKTAHIHGISAVRVVQAAEGKITGLAMPADGSLVAVSVEDKQVAVFDAEGMPVAQAATDDSLACVAYSEDGQQLAAAGADGNLSLWPFDAKGFGDPLKIAAGGQVHSIAYNADATRIAVAIADDQIRLFDSATGQGLEILETDGAPASLAFVPAENPEADGESLLLAAGDALHVQPVSLLRLLAGHEGSANAVAFSPDGSKLISGGADNTVRVWNAADGEPLATLAGPTEAVTRVAVSPDGALTAAASTDESVYLWQTPAEAAAQPVEAEATLAHAAPVRGVAFGGDASRLATGGDDGVVRVWDLATQRELERFPAHEQPVLSVALADDNRSVLSGSADKSARREIVSATRVVVADAGAVHDVALLPDGSQIASVGDDMEVKLWDLEGEPVRQLAGGKAPLVRLAIRGDGQQLAAADAEGRLNLWTLSDGTLAHTIETEAAIAGLCYSADHERIAIAGADDHLRVFDTSDALPLHELASDGPVSTVQFTPDGRQLVTNGSEDAIHVWAYASPVERASLTGHAGPVYCIAFGPDGTWAATGGADATIRVWDLEGGESKQLSGHAGAVYDVAVSSDGKQLISAGSDGTTRVWDVAEGKELKQYAAPLPEVAEGEDPPSPEPIYSVATNGTLVAACDSDGKVRVWNATAAEPLLTLSDHQDAVYRVAFNESGTRLLTCGHTGRVIVWNAADGKPLFEATVPSVAYDARLSADGTRIAVAGADGKTHLVDLPAAAR